jgi:hypothetical protein
MHSIAGHLAWLHKALGRRALWVIAYALASSLTALHPAVAADGPAPPCGAHMADPLPAFGAPPNARNWHARDLGPGWSAPDCAPWAGERFTVLTALAGTFTFAGTADDLLLRFGAFSAWRGIQYWSVTDGRWDVLVADAGALNGADAGSRRADFSLAELKVGNDLYFMQRDNRSADAVVYRMRANGAGADRLVVTVENVSPISVFLFTAFDAGDLKSTYIFQRLSPALWGYYSLSGAREGVALIGNHDGSYLNRALAIFRHMAGLPTDMEPPLAR